MVWYNKGNSAGAGPKGTDTPYKYLFDGSRAASRTGPIAPNVPQNPPPPQPQRPPPPQPKPTPSKPKVTKPPSPPKTAEKPKPRKVHPKKVHPAKPPQTPPDKNNNNKPPTVTTAVEKQKGPKPTKIKRKKVKLTKSQMILEALGKLKPMPPPPRSLTFLENLDSFFIQDSCEPIELWKGFETGTQFVVLDKNKERLFMATEKTKCLKLCMCRTDRTFLYKLFDKDGKEILRISRPCSCKCCCGAKLCGDLCGHKIIVTLEDGSKAGEVVQKCCGGGCRCCCTPMYIVNDCVGNPTLKIKGPSCAFMCCCRMSPCCNGRYKMLSLIKDPVMPVKIGEIANNWISNGSQFVQKGHALNSDSALTVGSTFPPNLDVRTKATVIGAMILLDFLHYEKEPCCGICQFCC